MKKNKPFLFFSRLLLSLLININVNTYEKINYCTHIITVPLNFMQ